MKRALFLAPLVLAGVVSLGCGGFVPDFLDVEVVPPPTEDWVGQWSSHDGTQAIEIEILADGTLRYTQESGASSQEYSGFTESWDGAVKCCFGLVNLSIDTPPTPLDGGGYTMTLDGVEYTRDLPAPEPGLEEL